MYVIDRQVLNALLLTTFAGLSTTIGSLIGLIFKRENPKFITFVLGFAAGVMVSISFLELLPEGIKIIGFLKANIAFFAGFIFIFLIDFFIPHEYIGQKENKSKNVNNKVLRAGLLTAIGVAIHNFPEGMAVFYSSLVDLRLGIPIAIAIAIHNIPEGIAISAPVYKATGNKKKAFLLSFLSGVAEPAGAIITAFFLLPFLTPQLLGYLLCGISGIMVFISLDELMPVSRTFGYTHLPIVSFIIGMLVMVLSLLLLEIF